MLDENEAVEPVAEIVQEEKPIRRRKKVEPLKPTQLKPTQRKAVNAVNFNNLEVKKNPDEKRKQIREEIEQASYVSISDIMVNRNRGGHPVLAKLEQTSKREAEQGRPRMWKLRCLVHQNGSKPQPGDEVRWKRQLHYKVDGRKLGSTEIQDMIRRGDGHLIVEMGTAKLDENCEFMANYADASYLLSQYGVYYVSNMPITDRKEIDKGGSHNWRFVEVIPDEVPQ